MRTNSVATLLIMSLAMSCINGCGGSSGPELGTVHGKVTLKGEPLPGALVSFYPEDGRPSMGTTDQQGQYQLDYTHDTPGAVIGTHTVRITTAQTSGEGVSEDKQKEIVPPQYNSDSELTKEVQSGDNTIDLVLE